MSTTSSKVFMLCKKCLSVIDKVRHIDEHYEICPLKNSEEYSKENVSNIFNDHKKYSLIKNSVSNFLGELQQINFPLQQIQTPPPIIKPTKLKVESKKVSKNPSSKVNFKENEKIIIKKPPKKNEKIDSQKTPSKQRYYSISKIEKQDEDYLDKKRASILGSKIENVEPYTKEEIFRNIEEEFSRLKTLGDIEEKNKALRHIQTNRKKLFCLLGPAEYTKILHSHLNRINSHFNSLTPAKIKKQILISFNTVEIKILEIDRYMLMETSDIDVIWFNSEIKKNKNDSLDFVVFDEKTLFSRILNYRVCINSIKDTLRQELFNIYGFNNVIYLKLSDNTQYSFYTLDKIEAEGRFWKMDCRMEILSMSVVDNLLEFCCDYFRKYYCNIYGDNDYRDKFWEHKTLTIKELQQLLENIIFLSNFYKVSEFLQTIVIENSSYTSTEIDKFNLKADDTSQQKRFKIYKEKNWKEDTMNKLRELFDTNCDNLEYLIN